MKTRKGEKRGNVKNFFKKGVIWSLVISLLFGAVIMTATTVAEENQKIDYDTVTGLIDSAAQAKMRAYVMKKCVEMFSTRMADDDEEVEDKSYIFNNSGGDEEFGVGPYIETVLANDLGQELPFSKIYGEIECEEDNKYGGNVDYETSDGNHIIIQFAQMIGKEGDLDILCNGNAPGLVVITNDNEADTSVNCRDALTLKSGDADYEFEYNKNVSGFYNEKRYNNGIEYVELLYSEWYSGQKNNNKYYVEWGEIDKFNSSTNPVDYRILFLDAEKGCNLKPFPENMTDGWVEIPIVSIDGSISDSKYIYSGTANKQQLAVYNSGNDTDCGVIIEQLGSGKKGGVGYTAYANEVQEGLMQQCNTRSQKAWNIAYIKALAVNEGKAYNFIKDGVEYSNGGEGEKLEYTDEQKSEAKNTIDTYNRLNKTKQFYRQDATTKAVSCILPDGWEADINVPTTLPDVTTGTAIDSCQSNAGALGWVICNVLELAGSAAESAYESFLKPQLEVNPVLIGATGNESTASAWSKFQGFANIVFAIVFLIIIFSQLTGYGIDNYGIKKILPKLIVTVILVNLSFVICQVAVDLSNILGNSLQNLFSSIRVDATLTETFEGTTDTFQISAGTQTLLWAVLVGVLVGGGIAIWRNPALLISLLISVLGVLIAGFFVFILLAARQAAIVVLIVLSPLAFVCYALPNTKKLFDKWLKLMQSLLLVYPICGLLIGGGDFASRLLLSAGLGTSFAAGLTAMLVGIVPIFFIPTVLKNSMSALGGLGAKISGLGNKVSGSTKGVLKNTRAYKNAQERGKARGDRRFAQARAGIRFDKDGKVVESRNPIARLRRRTADTVVGRFFGTGAAMGEQQAKLRGMEEKRQQNTMTAEVGVAPLVKSSNLKQKMQNAINEAVAENEVPVVPVAVDLAIQRRRSANEAQELKNYTDQFAGYTRAQLEAEMASAGDWLSKDGGTQRMQALISAAESQGMEKNIAGMLEKHGDAIGKNAKIMQTLAGSKNKVFKAYGKSGVGQSYEQFMNGTGSGKSLAKYVEEKGTDFLDGLDDKALTQIRKYQTSNNDIMGGDLLAQAAAKINSQDAMDEIDEMIKNKLTNGKKVEFSAAQYANLNSSTQNMLGELLKNSNSTISGNVRDNLVAISNDMINAPEQYARLKSESAQHLDEARARAGLGTMQDAIQSLHVPHSS